MPILCLNIYHQFIMYVKQNVNKSAYIEIS